MALVATIFDRTTNLVFRILALLFGSFILFGTFSHTDLNDLDTTWIIRVALATSFVSCAVGALRGFGFRLVALTEGVSRRDLEKATGHDFDEWFAILDAANGQSLNHAEIMAFLRRHGI